MKGLVLKRATAFALSFELILAPLGAHARIADPVPLPTQSDLKSDKFLEKMKNTVEMIARGDLPEFGPEDMDPKGVQGQYVNIYDRAGNIIDQYFLDEKSLDRPRPNFTKLRTALIRDEKTGQKCFVIEGTTGEDAHGNHGYVIARQYSPRMCGMVAVANDEEVLHLFDTRGHKHEANYNFIAEKAFQSKIEFERDVWEPAEPVDLSNENVEATVLTIGARPPSREEIPDGAVIPLNGAGQPYFTALDCLVRVNGRYWNLFSGQTSRERLLLALEQKLQPAAFYKGTPEQVARATQALEKAESDLADFKKRVNEVTEDSPDARLASLVHDLGPKGVADIEAQIKAYKRYSTRENDTFTLDEWLKDYKAIVHNSNVLNGTAIIPNVHEDRRLNWKKYFPSKFQTPEQQFRVRNETSSDKLRRMAPKYAKIAALIATTTAFLTYPMIVEHTPALQHMFLTNYLYRQWPAVLKDAAYRVPLLSSCLWLSLATFVPDVASFAAAGALAGLNKITMGRQGPVYDKIRNMTAFWVDQKNWQRITTFGYWLGGVLMVNPIVRVIENVLQQKEFMSAARLGIWPAKVVSPEDPIGKFMGLEEGQTVGLTKPSLAGMIRKIKRLNPGTEDLGGPAWERARHKFKQRLQLEVKLEKDRRREYARMLAGLVVAERHGLPYETMLLLMANRQFRREDLATYLKSERASEEWDVVSEATFKQIKDFAFEFKHSPIIHDLDIHELVKQGKEAHKIAIEINETKGLRRTLKMQRLKAKRRAVRVWIAALNQGKAESEALRGRVASENVFRNVQEFFPPDHFNVSVLPEVLNIPRLPSRANLANPSQLAARAGSFLDTSAEHMNDVGFNATVHGALGTVMDGLQYEVMTAKEEQLGTPRQDIANQVWARDEEGQVNLTVPVNKGWASRELYSGYVDQQRIWPAMKEYFKSLRKIDLSEQAEGYLNVSFQTIWIYMTLQFAMKVFVGHQGVGASLIAMNLLFMASPIFYKWWGWVIKPLNNLYRASHRTDVAAFLAGKRWLEKSERPGLSEDERVTLQEKGVRALFEQFAKTPKRFDAQFAPTASSYDAADWGKMAAYWSELTDKVSPEGLVANGSMTKLSNQVQAFGSTATASVMLVMGTDPAHQTLASLAGWTAGSFAWQLFFINFLGPNRAGYKMIKNAVGKVKSLFVCETALAE